MDIGYDQRWAVGAGNIHSAALPLEIGGRIGADAGSEGRVITLDHGLVFRTRDGRRDATAADVQNDAAAGDRAVHITHHDEVIAVVTRLGI